MVTEHKLGLYEARNTLGTLVMAAAYGPARFVIQRYGKTVAAVVGIAELEALRDLQNAEGEPELHFRLAKEIGERLLKGGAEA